jgi:hypothetical protein
MKIKLLFFFVSYFNLKSAENINYYNQISFKEKLLWNSENALLASVILTPVAPALLSPSLIALGLTDYYSFDTAIKAEFNNDQELLKKLSKKDITSFYRKYQLIKNGTIMVLGIMTWIYIYQKIKKLYFKLLKELNYNNNKFSLSTFISIVKKRLQIILSHKDIKLNYYHNNSSELFDECYFKKAITEYLNSMNRKNNACTITDTFKIFKNEINKLQKN